MRIKDIITTEQGLFGFINYTIDDFSFAQLDLLFISEYGEREISPIVESLLDDEKHLSNEKLALLGQIIYNMFSHSWDKQKAILDSEYNPMESYYETIETTRESENTNLTNIDNNTYAFNSIDSVDKDNTSQTSEGGVNETIIQTKKGLANGIYPDIIENALKARAIKLIDIVFNDIKWFISLNLYK